MLEVKKINGKMVKDETARNSITGLQTQINNIEVPTKTSDLTNDSNYVTKTYVDTAIENITTSGGGNISVSYDEVNEELTFIGSNISYDEGNEEMTIM